MGLASTDELLLVALAPDDGSEGGGARAAAGPERALSTLLDTLASGSDRLSEQVEIVAAVEDLIQQGLAERRRTDDGTTLVALTAAGCERGIDSRADLVGTAIEVVEGDRRRTEILGEFAARRSRDVVAVAAECTAEGVFYRDEGARGEGLVDREAECAAWTEVLDRVGADRRGEVVVLVGPGGIGKTVLADHLAELASDAGFDVVRGRCRGAGGEPYALLRAALSEVDGAADPFDRTRIDPDDAETYETEQRALYHDLTEALSPTDAEPPRVLVLEDLHHAGTATRAYLEFLFERLPDRPLAVLGSYRPSEVSGEPPFVPAAVPSATPTTTLALSGLDREGTGRIAERVLERRGLPEDLVDAVHDRTAGNPLFVEATVESLLETDQLDPHLEWYPETPDAIELPGRVRDTIRQQLTALDEPARDLLRWAAVAGESVTKDVLTAVCPAPPHRVRTSLEVVRSANVLAVDDETVTFSSAVVRESLLEDLADDERARRHESLARALENRTDEEAGTAGDHRIDRAAAIAHHREQAGDEAAAIEWYRTAIDRATDVYAHETAIEHCRRALELARAADREESLLDVGERLAELYSTVGSYGEAERYVRFVRERTPDEDHERRQRLARLAGRCAMGTSDYETAVGEVSTGLELGEDPTPERCRLLGTRASAERGRGDYDRAEAAARRQREMARQLDESGIEARALEHLGQIAYRRSDYEPAEGHLEDALELFEAVGDDHGVARVRNKRGTVLQRGGDFLDAQDDFEAAREAFERQGDRDGAARARSALGTNLLRRGEFDAAREHYRQALDRYRTVGARHKVAVMHNNLATCAVRRGDYDDAREHLRRALELMESVGNDQHVAVFRLNLGSTESSMGHYERARDRVTTALSFFREVEHQTYTATALTELGAIARMLGDEERAREHVEEALEVGRESGPHDTIEPRMELATLARQRGDYGTARSELEGALETAEETDARRHIGGCHAQLGAVARGEGELERAADHLETAREWYDERGDRRGLAFVALRRGRLERERGNTAAARGLLMTALAGFGTTGLRHWAGRAHHDLGTVAAESGDATRARDRWTDALDVFEDVGAVDDALRTLRRLVEAALGDGHDAAAGEYCDRALALLEDGPVPDREDREAWFRERAAAAGPS